MRVSINNVKHFNWNGVFFIGLGFKQYILGIIIQEWGMRICFLYWQLIISWEKIFERKK